MSNALPKYIREQIANDASMKMCTMLRNLMVRSEAANKAIELIMPYAEKYSRGNIDKWVEKCYRESQSGVTVVALLPVSTSAEWFHKWVWKKAELRFIKRRVRFVGAPFTAPFSSVIAIWKPAKNENV